MSHLTVMCSTECRCRRNQTYVLPASAGPGTYRVRTTFTRVNCTERDRTLSAPAQSSFPTVVDSSNPSSAVSLPGPLLDPVIKLQPAIRVMPLGRDTPAGLTVEAQFKASVDVASQPAVIVASQVRQGVLCLYANWCLLKRSEGLAFVHAVAASLPRCSWSCTTRAQSDHRPQTNVLHCAGGCIMDVNQGSILGSLAGQRQCCVHVESAEAMGQYAVVDDHGGHGTGQFS